MLLLIVILVLGAVMLRRTALPEGTAEAAEPSVRTVRASVDGKPVHSYVMADRDEKQNAAGRR